MIPLQFAAVYPRFLTNEPQMTNGEYYWPNSSQMMDRDRRFYLQCIGNIALARGGTAKTYYEVLQREDEVRRYWWFSAVSRLDIMRAVRNIV